MKSLGTYLKGERESRKISLDEISRATKIRRAILEAIERDQAEGLLPEAVVKGFIKTYARHIGLDPKEVLSTCEERRKGDETPEEARLLSNGRRRIPPHYVFAGGICVLIIIAISLLFFSERGPREGAQEAVFTSPATEQITMVPSEDLQSSSSLPSIEETMPLQTPPVGGEEARKAHVVAAGEEVATVQEDKSQPVPEHTLVITALERTWIQIQEGSSLPFDIILYPGDNFTRTSSQQLAVVIGNAGGVTVSFNGKGLESLGKNGEVVRLTLPAPEEG